MTSLGTMSRRFMQSQASALTKRKRFYKDVSLIKETENGEQYYKIALDNRILKTQGGSVLKLKSEGLAHAVREEWASQDDSLKLGQMRLTGLAFTAQDNPLEQSTDLITKKCLEYLEGDTVLFWNPESEKLHRYQREHWGPLITNINKDLGVQIRASESIIDCEVVNAADKEKVGRWVRNHNFASLIGLLYATESVKSFVTAFNVINFHATAEEAVDAATLEQRTQAETWGSVEWAHGVEREELLSRLSAAALFVYFNSNNLQQQTV